MTGYLVPLLLFLAAAGTLCRGKDAYTEFIDGAASGLTLLKQILPGVLALLAAVGLLQAAGADKILERVLSPLFSLAGIPGACGLIVLIRPFSGSGALAAGTAIITQYGVNSTVGRTAAVMLGSTETTFYVIGVYFGGTGVKRFRYTVLAALLADLTGFVMAAVSVRLFF